eukprot:TRINITY_DN5410_c0_g1_i1.p1 TRINITY_DN5410_c0_g1~~TRINITY_DN5410_c0_g1_i1.p1  ORF type:complete len:112 (-),score=25.43 TRINITY_DN5410_c0_g1_i1:34-369(-)
MQRTGAKPKAAPAEPSFDEFDGRMKDDDPQSVRDDIAEFERRLTGPRQPKRTTPMARPVEPVATKQRLPHAINVQPKAKPKVVVAHKLTEEEEELREDQNAVKELEKFRFN